MKSRSVLKVVWIILTLQLFIVPVLTADNSAEADDIEPRHKKSISQNAKGVDPDIANDDQGSLDIFDDLMVVTDDEDRKRLPVMEIVDESELTGDEEIAPRWMFGGAGFNHLKLEGINSDIGNATRGENDTIGLVLHFSDKYTSHLSLDSFVTYSELGDLILANTLLGIKYDLSPFPKTFMTPWAGLYLSVNFLDDTRNNPESGEPQEDWDGLGVGLAAGAGINFRVGKELMVQFSVRRNDFGAVAILDNFTQTADRMNTTEFSLVFIILADTVEEIQFQD